MRNRIVLALAFLFFLVPESGSLLAQAPPQLRDPNEDPQGTAGALRPQIETAGSYSAYSGNGTRVVTDLSVPGALGEYGLDFTRYWNSVHNDTDYPHASRPFDFGASGWSHSWSWKAEYAAYSEMPDDGGEELFHTQIIITFPDGHTTTYKIVRSSHPVGIPPDIVFPDRRLGQPYTDPEITMGWPYGGLGVHDRLTKMATDGSQFYLALADGGSVHFEWFESLTGGGYYLATEVFDRHGLRTVLQYNSAAELTRVTQDGGRYLDITWNTFNPDNWRVITKVETGGTAGFQRVQYGYTRMHGGYFLVLANATYENDPAPGQTTSASYAYGNCFGGGPETCGAAGSEYPLLQRADDPRTTQVMTKIRYAYRGAACPTPPPTLPWQPPLWVPALAEAIAAEKSDARDAVSWFVLDCESGERVEYNGLGGQRKFYFGSAAGTYDQTTSPPLGCKGYQLGKVTDFTKVGSPIGTGTPCPPGVPCRRQNYHGGEPRRIWDARNPLPTESLYLDGSGSPTEVRYLDTSNSTYDRITQGDSLPVDESRMHNDGKHWLFRKKDENGNVTVYRRDERRRVTDIYYYDASNNLVASEGFMYNHWNQVTRHTLPSGAQQHYVYNDLQQLVWEWNSVNEEQKKYEYDGLGRVWRMRDTRDIVDNAPYTELMEYNGRHLVTKIHYRATGGNQDPTVTYQYDKYGNRTAVINELGHRKDYTYDSYRRCTSMTEQLNAPGWNGSGNVASRTWNWVYDRVIDYADGTQQKFPHSAHTSKEWRVQVEPAFNAEGQRRVTARTFDVNNRMMSEQTGWIQPPGAVGPSNPWFQGPNVETHRFTYDENGQKSSYKDPHGRITTYEYNNRNRLEKTKEPKRLDQNDYPETRIEYDFAGNKKKVTFFPDMKTQRWDNYDPFGQAWKSFDEYDRPTDLNYKWGPMKKLEKVIARRDTEDQVTEFIYDEMGRSKKTIFPDDSFEENTYEVGQLSAFKTRRNQWKRLYYDARGREDYHTWDNGAAPGINREWDDAGRLTRIENVYSKIDYGYDDAGQVKWEGNEIAGTGRRETRYCRFPSGEVSRLTYPNEFVVQRRYTARGQLERADWTGGSVEYAYLADGKVDFQNYGNGVQSDLDYDGRGFINLSKTYRVSGGQTYARRDYWRDNLDRIKGWKKGNDVAANPLENGRGDRYDYDYKGQLTLASYQVVDPVNNPTGAQRADDFHYDWLGNRRDLNHVASRGQWMTMTRRESNGLNQYNSWHNQFPGPNPPHWGTGVFYDDNVPPPDPIPPNYPYVFPGNGVLMQDGYITGGFNALNQPVGIWSKFYAGTPNWMFFGYDPLGRCVKRLVGPHVNLQVPPADTNPATYFYYDGWNLIQEGPNGSEAERTYVHGNRVDEIVASVAAGAGWLYHHYDARGHCILQTNASGGLQEQYDYDAFGWPYFYTATGAPAFSYGRPGSPSGNRFLFTGREWIKHLKLYDYRNRMYQPELGRFLQPDPKQFEAGDYNLYRYCHNDPVNRSDPTGLVDTQWDRQTWLQGSSPISFHLTEAIKRFHSAGTLAAVVIAQDNGSDKTFDSSRGAGRAGATEAIPNALHDKDRKEWKGLILESKADRGVFVYTAPVRGTRGQVADGLSQRGTYNTSVFDPKDAPAGFRLVGGYWALPRYQLGWPEGDRQRLYAGGLNGVLGMPPPAGATSSSVRNQNRFLFYDHDPNVYPPSDAAR